MTIKKLYTPAEVIETRNRLYSLTCDQMISRGYINIPEVLRDLGTYSVVVRAVGQSIIPVIKEIRFLTGLGLADAKALADNTPSVIIAGVTEREATIGAQQLRSAGAAASVVREVTA